MVGDRGSNDVELTKNGELVIALAVTAELFDNDVFFVTDAIYRT